MSNREAYIIAARRTALGRIGGLHRGRRLDALTAPVVAAAIDDARVGLDEIDRLFLGNASEGGNPARLVALAAGLPETVPATTVDCQCGSGLEAIMSGIRAIRLGEADITLGGGAESLSTAPWRIMRPRSLYQTPHFMRYEPSMTDSADEPQPFEASEAMAKRLEISRSAQDAWALQSFQLAEQARDARRFTGEIVALRANAEETRDQSATTPDADDFQDAIAFLPEDGTLTPANTSAMHDGAASAVIVSGTVWERLGHPPALRFVAGACQGVNPGDEASAPMQATEKLFSLTGTPGNSSSFALEDVDVVELSESSAAQAIAFGSSTGISQQRINPDGGAIVRGHPFGASGAVLIARLFTDLVRNTSGKQARLGLVTQGAIGGLGMAALFERV